MNFPTLEYNELIIDITQLGFENGLIKNMHWGWGWGWG
jgi:hypothetical protein